MSETPQSVLEKWLSGDHEGIAMYGASREVREAIRAVLVLLHQSREIEGGAQTRVLDLEAERDALRGEVKRKHLALVAEGVDLALATVELRNVRAALRHWQTRESAMDCDACACLGLALPDELRDTAPREEE
jgi:hypothetical protein